LLTRSLAYAASLRNTLQCQSSGSFRYTMKRATIHGFVLFKQKGKVKLSGCFIKKIKSLLQ